MSRRGIALFGLAALTAAFVALADGDSAEAEGGRSQLEKMLLGVGEGVCDQGDGVVSCESYMPVSADCGAATRADGQVAYRCRVTYPPDGPLPRIVCVGLHESRYPIREWGGEPKTILRVGYTTFQPSRCAAHD